MQRTDVLLIVGHVVNQYESMWCTLYIIQWLAEPNKHDEDKGFSTGSMTHGFDANTRHWLTYAQRHDIIIDASSYHTISKA